ncbi:regulatory protein GemA [Shewanella sp. GutCb]|uniref:gp16 family protein n=1 Tax=Shewanella sp. GutCb TaxID=2058315 RepID=UPI000C7CE1F1|nr:regulatory protein GemA [Shewanella sp. GutCb]PKG73146.1 regulatory protein GemA [Shewanella sp. GutCb]
MKKQFKPKSWYIKMIHIGKSQLRIDEQSYRANLMALTGKRSCLDMGIPDLFKVLEFLKSKGFKFQARKTTNSTQKAAPTQLDKLRYIWITMNKQGFLRDGSDSALNKWSTGQAKRLNNGNAIAKLEWLQPNMLNALIEQLKKWHIRMLNEAIDHQYPTVALLSQEGRLSTNDHQAFVELDDYLKTSRNQESLSGIHNALSLILSHDRVTPKQAGD